MLNRKNFTDELEYLVNIDSGTYVRDGVNKVGEWFADKFSEMNWKIKWYDIQPDELGNSFLVYPDNDNKFDLLILCHLDTVFPEGEAQKRPFTVEGTRFRGPGVADMKSGLLFTYYALKQIYGAEESSANIGVYFNREHEISCPNTRTLIEELSSKSNIVITSEPSRASGAYVNRRKGIGRYKLSFLGKSAHSGVNPEQGVDAVAEMAHWVLFLKELSEPDKGIYVNSGMAKGGIAINAVPGNAELSVDVRFFDIESGNAIDRSIRDKVTYPFNKAIKINLEGGIMRPPMIPSEKTDKLCRIVDDIGKTHGVDVRWETSGGGSDASFAAALGIPSLCGLTAVGGKLHSEQEYLETADLESRFEVYKEMIYQFSNL